MTNNDDTAAIRKLTDGLAADLDAEQQLDVGSRRLSKFFQQHTLQLGDGLGDEAHIRRFVALAAMGHVGGNRRRWSERRCRYRSRLS